MRGRPHNDSGPGATARSPRRGAGRLLRALALSSAAVAPLASGCVAVAAGGLGVMLSQEFQKGAQIVHYDRDAELVWLRVKETLSHLSTRQPIFEEAERRAFATVEGGAVRVDVIEASEGRCRVSVTGRRYGLQSPELALSTLDAVDAQVRR